MRDLVYLRGLTYNLFKQLQPTGRAWQFPDGSDGDLDMQVKSEMAADFLYQIENFVSSIIPDNQLFNEIDAENWERRLALDYDAATLSLDERKAEILRKISYPGGFKYTLSLEFIEFQLRASLFDIRVYRNPNQSQPANTELIANSVEKEDGFVVTDYYHTFIIAGESIDSLATIELKRRNEFIRKILKYKPMNMVCYLLSNINKAEGVFILKYDAYYCEIDFMFRQNGYKRASAVIVEKKVDGITVSGYPKSYNVLLSFGSYDAITSAELLQLTIAQFNARINAFETYVEENEAGSNFDTDLVAGFESRIYDPTSCPIDNFKLLKFSNTTYMRVNDNDDLLKTNQ